MNINQAVGIVIRRALKDSGMTAKQVARKAGYSPQTVYNMMHGRCSCSISALCDICQTLGIDPDAVIRGAQNSLKNPLDISDNL